MVLIDTSVWIEYFRGRPKIVARVNRLLDSGEAVICGVILAELLAGARDKSFQSKIVLLKDVCGVLEEVIEDWIEAGILNRELRNRGRTIGLVDCYLAALVIKHRMDIWSHDKDFSMLAAFKKGFSLRR